MVIKLGSNIASLNAQRRLTEASSELSKTFERLSSGQRINRASDDAAGLAIADSLKAKSRVYTQAIRNGNDGISLLNIADSALETLTSVVIRIKELSEQSANGSYSARQRAALDAEAQQLSKEFTRITQTTSFNGTNIFDGSLSSGARLQLGIGSEESINASIGGGVGTGSFVSLSTYSADTKNTQAVELGDLNGDGILDLISGGYDDSNRGTAIVRLGLGNGQFGTATTYTTTAGRSYSMKLADLNGDGILDMLAAGQDGANHGVVAVRLGNGNGTFGAITQYTTEGYSSRDVVVGDLNGDSYLDLISAGYASLTEGQMTVRLGNGNGTFGSVTAYTGNLERIYKLSLGDLNGDHKLDIIASGYDGSFESYSSIRLGSGDGKFGTASLLSVDASFVFASELVDLNNDNILDYISAGFDSGFNNFINIKLGKGDGSFISGAVIDTGLNSVQSLKAVDLNGDGNIDLVAGGFSGAGLGYASIMMGSGNGQFSSDSSFTVVGRDITSMAAGDLNGDGAIDLVTGGSLSVGVGTYDGKVAVKLGTAVEGRGALEAFSLKTRSDSLQSMTMLDKALQSLAKQRGQIGASQSRVVIAINNLQSARENFEAAESRIRDADISSEAAALVRTQILQQSATSVLAQANQQPSITLKLLS